MHFRYGAHNKTPAAILRAVRVINAQRRMRDGRRRRGRVWIRSGNTKVVRNPASVTSWIVLREGTIAAEFRRTRERAKEKEGRGKDKCDRQESVCYSRALRGVNSRSFILGKEARYRSLKIVMLVGKRLSGGGINFATYVDSLLRRFHICTFDGIMKGR